MLRTTVSAQEYGPHAKLTIEQGYKTIQFSGEIIESPEDEIWALTCWHGTMGFQNVPTMTVEVFQPTVDNTQLSAKVTMKVVKSDPDRDILLLKSKNPLKLKIKRLKIGQSTLLDNTKTLSYGYAMTDILIQNSTSIKDYRSTTQQGNIILSVNGQVVSGMSGGGLLYGDELYGIQSAGKDRVVSYCPADQLLEFVK
jgi:hypothetical protein